MERRLREWRRKEDLLKNTNTYQIGKFGKMKKKMGDGKKEMKKKMGKGKKRKK